MLWSLGFLLLAATILTIVYYMCYFALAIGLGVSNRHYFLGFGGSLFEFRVGAVLFTVGIFIPVFGFARVSKVEDHTRRRLDYPWQFFNRPLWARLLTTFGGAISLFLCALIILIAIRFFVKEHFISRNELNQHGIYPSALAEQFGFERGDKVLTINGREFEAYEELLDPDIYTKAGNTFKIVRNNEERIIRVPEGDHRTDGRVFLELISPVIIDSVFIGSPAEEAQLKNGDRIVSVNGKRIDKASDMRDEFQRDVDRTVDLQIQRVVKSDTLHITVKAMLGDQHNLGILTREKMKYTTRKNSFLEAVEKGTKTMMELVKFQTMAWFGSVAPARAGGGPVSVSTLFGDGPDWRLFWYATANWAILFATWNLCPFPRSAFWETIPLAFEAVSGKRFSSILFARSRVLAWFIFWGLIFFTVLMDISKLF